MGLTIGVLKETFAGERRVAMVPRGMDSLTKAGAQIWVESGAGVEAGVPDKEYTAKGAKWPAPPRGPQERSDPSLCPGAGFARADEWTSRHRHVRPAVRAATHARSGAARHHSVCDGVDPAHHARAEHGRALVDGDHRRLQSRAAGRRTLCPDVPDDDDRGRHHPARASVRHRRGRGRTAGDRDRPPAGRGGQRLRRAPGRQGTDRKPGRQVRRARHRGEAPRKAATPRRIDEEFPPAARADGRVSDESRMS